MAHGTMAEEMRPWKQPCEAIKHAVEHEEQHNEIKKEGLQVMLK